VTRTTGKHSLNTHIHGHAEDIAKQANQPKSLIYDWLCLLAAEEELIPVREVFGKWFPAPESEWDTAQASSVIMLIHRVADERRLWLTEYDEKGVASRVWYGKEHHE